MHFCIPQDNCLVHRKYFKCLKIFTECLLTSLFPSVKWATTIREVIPMTPHNFFRVSLCKCREMQAMFIHFSFSSKKPPQGLEAGAQERVGPSSGVVNFKKHSVHLWSCSSLSLEARPVPTPSLLEHFLPTLQVFKISSSKRFHESTSNGSFLSPFTSLKYFHILVTFN